MNRQRQRPAPLPAVITALADLGLSVDVASARRREDHDTTVTIGSPGGTHAFRATIKRHVSRALLGSITTLFSARPEDSLLVTDYVTPPLAEELRRNGIQFADAAGNVFLRRPGLLVYISGRKLSERPRQTPTPRVFRTTGLKVVFALLSLPDLVNATQRDIAAAAGVALGSVPVILNGLRQLGFVDEVGGKRQLLERERLLVQWTEAYARTLEPTLELSRFAAPDPRWWRRGEVVRYSAQWGGETAAALLHRHLVPESAVVYVERIPTKMLLEHRLKADPKGDVVFRKRFWKFEMPWKRQDLVPPLLIYADLLAAGDGRSLTAAREIHDEYLARPVERR